MKKEILRMSNIVSYNETVQTVKNAELNIFEGEVAGLIGKNYMGKRAFIGAITGETPCQSGTIWINEKKVLISSIEKARNVGVFQIKQETSIIETFTIGDMIAMSYAFMKKKNRSMKYSAYLKVWDEVLQVLEVNEVDTTLIGNMHFSKRVLIEFAQALCCEAKLLVLDNIMNYFSPTAKKHMEKVFLICRGRGVSILLIENNPESLLPLVSRMFIMRKGRIVDVLEKNELNTNLILSLMEGEAFQYRQTIDEVKERIPNKKTMIRFEHSMGNDENTKDVFFTLYENEILGLWNQNRHSGKSLADIFIGRNKIRQGELYLFDRLVRRGKVDPYEEKGIYVITEEEELFSNMNFEENLEMGALKKNAFWGIVKNERELHYQVQEIMGEYFSTESRVYQPHQYIPDNLLIKKKVVLCRAILAKAKVIIYCDPWIKMDMREQEAFTQDILRTRKHGITQLIISSQIDLLCNISNRVLQIDQGEIVKEIHR
ncbi:MAG: ATP-binding cassette domain-containing protein [Lachnospiraceae bacterium]|nr:ATP-binding cassette domain-containing protein [Lachnospiraceae bacterium]